MILTDAFVCSVSGGFATVHPNNRLTINVVEGAPLEEFSIEVGFHNKILYAVTQLVPIF
jgi:hypothetical protein